jgi:heterodisulfide reductase subunit C
MLFVSAKVSHLGLMPQGEIESDRRVQAMVHQMDKEGFGKCSNTYACEAECPKDISVSNIARLKQALFQEFFSREDLRGHFIKILILARTLINRGLIVYALYPVKLFLITQRGHY